MRSRQTPVAWWSATAAVAAPVILAGTATTTRDLYRGIYSPESQTLSSLARRGALDWVMVTGIAGVGACLIVTAAGLYVMRWLPRLVLGLSGFLGLLFAARPLLDHETVHIVVTSLGGVGLAAWPALTVLKHPGAPRLCEPRYAFPVSAATATLLLWTGFELFVGGRMLGLAERITVLSELAWPAVVVVAALLQARTEADTSLPVSGLSCCVQSSRSARLQARPQR